MIRECFEEKSNYYYNAQYVFLSDKGWPKSILMGVNQKIPNDVKITFFHCFYCLLTFSAWPGRLGAISKKAIYGTGMRAKDMQT
jgi:hypothetical protein